MASEAPTEPGSREAALFLSARLEDGISYTRNRKNAFRRSASLVKILSLLLSAVSTIILGLQELNFWAALAFSLVALTTVVNSIEPFFNWRSRWILMEDLQARFHRLDDELKYLLSVTSPQSLSSSDISPIFQEHQRVWREASQRWIADRNQSSAPAGDQ